MSTLDRRGFLGTVLHCSGAGVLAGTSPLLQAQGLPAAATALVLYRAELPESNAFAQVWAEAGLATLPLACDVVRQWRDGLGAQFSVQQRLLIGLGSWDDQVLLQGLAAEQRRHLLLVMQHPLKLQAPGWAAQHARELVALTQQSAGAESDASLQALAGRQHLRSGTPSLFSWVLG
jgi:hypothetical protein